MSDDRGLVYSLEGVLVCANCGGTGVDEEYSKEAEEVVVCRYYEPRRCDL